MSFRILLALSVVGASLVGRAQAQDPAALGPLAVTEWDAGRVTAATLSVPTVVVHPNDVGPHPVVGVFHGFEGESVDHQLLARTLASYGLVVIRSTMPCRLTTGCDHGANAAAMSALLDWAVAQSAVGGSPLEGRVDGSRRGLVGHSFGALNAHLAGSRDPSIDSIVLIDPNDDTGLPGRLAAPSVTAATAQILAAIPGSCNSLWDDAAITPMLPAPKLALTVSRSGHCDPTDAADAICTFGCGAGDRTTSAIFRRYTVAWTVCNLIGDPAMAPWLGGSSLASDVDGNVVRGVMLGGADALRCRDGSPFDGGVIADEDAGALDGGEGDAGEGSPDAGASDGGAMDAGRDAGIAGLDAGSSGVAGGCACRADHRGRPGGGIFLLIAGLLALRRHVPKRTPRPASAQSAGMRP